MSEDTLGEGSATTTWRVDKVSWIICDDCVEESLPLMSWSKSEWLLLMEECEMRQVFSQSTHLKTMSKSIIIRISWIASAGTPCIFPEVERPKGAQWLGNTRLFQKEAMNHLWSKMMICLDPVKSTSLGAWHCWCGRSVCSIGGTRFLGQVKVWAVGEEWECGWYGGSARLLVLWNC